MNRLEQLMNKSIKSSGKTDLKRLTRIVRKAQKYHEEQELLGIRSDFIWNEATVDEKLDLIRKELVK